MPRGLGAITNPIGWFSSTKTSALTPAGAETPTNELVPHSPQGLRSTGRALIERLVRHGVWIDLSHASDAFAADVIPLLREAHQPLLLTHSMLRRYYHSERGAPIQLLNEVKATGGIVGVLPSEDITGKTPSVEARNFPSCGGGVGAYLTQVDEIAAVIGLDSVGVGSDVNAPLRFLQASCSRREIEPNGFYSYAQYPVLRELMGQRGPGLTGEHFLRAWRMVVPTTISH